MKKSLRLALAGNANVGKSVLFNSLTGGSQTIGNWPGKTVEKAEGVLKFRGRKIDVIDLPGIYSLSAYSVEESITRDYIAKEKPDAVVNVVDACALERNLFLTLQLIELGAPIIIAVNQADLAERKGLELDLKKLSKKLGVPVVRTIATNGTGVKELVERAVETAERKRAAKKIMYGKEVEKRISELEKALAGFKLPYGTRFSAIKLLEGDEGIARLVNNEKVLARAAKLSREIEKLHGEPAPIVVSSERYAVASRIASECQTTTKPKKTSVGEAIDSIALNKYFGYPLLALVMLAIFFTIFALGGQVSAYLAWLVGLAKPIFASCFGEGILFQLIWGGAIEGFTAGLTVALPYLLPFFVILGLLEDTGYLARIAFLMDGVMHRMGLHGKAFIPLILGYGCAVPACIGCRVLEKFRDRFVTAVLSTLVPCAARTVIILGLVGAYLGVEWALALYAFNLLVIFVLGRLARVVLPGETTGLIMEMPSYKVPSLAAIFRKTWLRLKEFVYVAFPLIITGSIVIKAFEVLGFLAPISSLLSPITVGWLGLPAVVGITLVLGVLRKELALLMLAVLLGTQNFGSVLTPIQMIVFTLVTMFYIPCIATISALVKEFGWKKAACVTLFEVVFALLLGGLAYRLLPLFGV